MRTLPALLLIASFASSAIFLGPQMVSAQPYTPGNCYDSVTGVQVSCPSNLSAPDPSLCYEFNSNLSVVTNDDVSVVDCQTGESNGANDDGSSSGGGTRPTHDGSDVFDIQYLDFTVAECNALAPLDLPDNIDPNQAAITQARATFNKNSCNFTLTKVTEACAPGQTSTAARPCLETIPLFQRFITIINFLSMGVGVTVTAIIVGRAIQFTTAGGNPQKASAAKLGILHAVLALGLYIFAFAILQWLIPGGIF